MVQSSGRPVSPTFTPPLAPSGPPPLTRSQSAPSILTSTPSTPSVQPSGLQGRTQSTEQTQQLTSSSTVSSVGAQASGLGSEVLQENASQHQDLQSALSSTVSGSSSSGPSSSPSVPPVPPPQPSSGRLTPPLRTATTPQQKLEKQAKDLAGLIDRLSERMNSLSETINAAAVQEAQGRSLSPQQAQEVRQAKAEVAHVEGQLTQVMTKFNEVSGELRSMEGAMATRKKLTSMDPSFMESGASANVVRAEHVINTHIIQGALETPEIRQTKGQLKDLGVEHKQLTRQKAILTSTIAELNAVTSQGGTLTPDQTTLLRDATSDLALVNSKLTRNISRTSELREQLSTQQAQAHAATEGDHHPPSTWEQVKGRLIHTPASKSEFFMTAAIDFRRQVIDTMIREEAAEQGAEVDQSADGSGSRTITKIVGSASQTSDRDVNLTVKDGEIGLDNQMVTAINSRFREVFGEDSGTYFDTNLYTEGLMPDTSPLYRGEKIDVWTNPVASRLNDSLQDQVSLAKQRGFFSSSEEWAEHTTAILDGMRRQGASPEVIAATRTQYESADTFIVDADRQINSRTAKLREENPRASETALRTMASNELYVEYMGRANLLMKAAVGGDGQIDEVKLAEARHQMGLAHYFANEAGMSEGVLRDVVVNGQELTNFIKANPGTTVKLMDLSASQLTQSFNENLGETLKEFNHHHKNLGDGAYNCSKYLGRLGKSLDGLLQKAGQSDNPAAVPLRELANKFIMAERGFEIDVRQADGSIKKEKAGLLDLRKNERIPELAARFGVAFDANNLDAVKEQIAERIMTAAGLGGIHSVDDFRRVIKEFGQQVNALIRTPPRVS